jgi:hypothetical protein
MTSLELRKLFLHHAEEAQFKNWNKGASEVRFVYACEYGTIWKFTPKEWWQFVRKAVGNYGIHEFMLSTALRNRPSFIKMGGDRKISSSESGIRCVNPLDWTIEDWTSELMPS